MAMLQRPGQTGYGNRPINRTAPGRMLQRGMRNPGQQHPVGRPPFHLPNFGQQGPQGPPDMASIIQALSGGVNQSQFQRMEQGYTGANGAIGGMHGAMAGLSPWAVHYLTTSGLLSPKAFTPSDTTGLTGDDLYRANFMNTLGQQNAQQHPTYGLNSAVTPDFLSQVFAQMGHPAFAGQGRQR